MRGKKLRIVIIFCIIAGIILLFWYFLLSPAKKGPGQNLKSDLTGGTNSRSSTPNNSTVTQPAGFVPGWILSDNDVYSFEYPSNWKLDRSLFSGGQTVRVIPVVPQANPAAVSWSITITGNDFLHPQSAEENLYINAGYSKNSLTISGNPAEKLSSPQETDIFVSGRKYSYHILYRYPNTDNAKTQESLLLKITNTLSIEE